MVRLSLRSQFLALWVLLLAILCGGCGESVNQRDIVTQLQPQGLNPSPNEWAVECIHVSSDLYFVFIHRDEPVAHHIGSCFVQLCNPQRPRVVIPKYTPFMTIQLLPVMGFAQFTNEHVTCYAMGYERASPLSDDVAAPDPKGIEQCKFTMLPWNNSNHDFSGYWAEMDGTHDYMPLAAKVVFWRQVAKDEKQRPAVQSILCWYLARYEAAVTQDPHLKTNTAAADSVATLRRLLAEIDLLTQQRVKE